MIGAKKTVGKELTAAAAGESVIASAITSTIMGIAIGGASSQVWGLINGLQLVVHLPLVMNAKFPEVAHIVFDKLIVIA